MRWILKAVAGIVSILLLAFAVLYYWLVFYSADLPDVVVLQRFSPVQQTTASDNCLNNPVVVLPPGAFGKYLSKAIMASAGFKENLSTIKVTSQVFTDELPTPILPIAVARFLLCDHLKPLHFQTQWIRTSIRVERRFTNEQLVTIYMNHSYFGNGLYGAYAASQTYFGKQPSELTLSEAVILARIIQAPGDFLRESPNRLNTSRNYVLEKMVKAGTITPEELKAAEQEPLLNLNGPATKKR